MPALSDRQKDRATRRQRHGAVNLLEALAVVVVVAAVIAMAIWFFFFAHGGIGPGAL
jgi:hypothetical protein